MFKKINKNIILTLKPCKDRFNNFITNYPDFNGDLKDFLYLDNITYSDKVWVFTRLATHIQNVKWSLLCAESIIHLYETKYPKDNRPRLALETANAFILDPSEKNKDAANAANAAAYAAYAAANAAANAANAEKNQGQLNLIFMIESIK